MAFAPRVKRGGKVPDVDATLTVTGVTVIQESVRKGVRWIILETDVTNSAITADHVTNLMACVQHVHQDGLG